MGVDNLAPGSACGCQSAEPAYSIQAAAAIKSVSPDTIRRAVRATAPPYISAKRVGNRYLIPASELDRWFDSLEDA